MHLFTWNVGGRPAMAPYAFAYLERIASADSVIATLQEWPGDFPDLRDRPLKVVPKLGQQRSDKAIVLYSSDLELRDHALDASKRATVARFRLPAGNEITCVGLHWYSRDSDSEIVDAYERGGAMALFRHHLDDRLGNDTPAVIMGDFNCSAHEHEREMCSRYCLFALSARHRTRPAMEKVMGREKRPWVLVEPDVPRRVGTFFHRHNEAWIMLDHVVLTPDLARGLVRAEVLTQMEGHSFLSRDKQVPRGKKHASDHLPVVCQVHYQ